MNIINYIKILFLLENIQLVNKLIIQINNIIIKNFKDFLLTQSTIRKTFINDFFEIIREDYFEI